MTAQPQFHPASPLLKACVPTLPAIAYYDPDWFADEQRKIWSRHWIYAGRVSDLPVMTMRRVPVANDTLILVKDQGGKLSAFHNTCRHRGAELCSAHEQQLKSRLITCPYHQWAYDFDGNLVRTPFAVLTEDFDPSAHGLFRVALQEWNGSIYVSLADTPPDFAAAPDFGISALDNWPMRDLVTGHRHVVTLNCNWKIFWENYNECLHCPGIHPQLCDMVPVYRDGIMAPEEAASWMPTQPAESHHLKPGARSWTVNGLACGPEFPGLDAAQRNAGHTFVTLYPTQYIVAHVDYVRMVSMRPLGPEHTELTAEWLFPADTLAASGFDLDNVVAFAKTVMREDGAACEMNHRGMRSSRYQHGTLVPQEYAVAAFQGWVRRQLA